MDQSDNEPGKIKLTPDQQRRLQQIQSQPNDDSRLQQVEAKAQEQSDQMDLRTNADKKHQWLHDWETPMWLIVILNIICVLLGPLARTDFAMSSPALKQGRFVTIISAMFMHADILHMALNMFMLVILGVILDSIPVSRYVTLMMFLIGGVLCNLCVLPFIWHTHMLVMGASGGVATLDGMAIMIIVMMLLGGQKIIKIDAHHIYSLYGWKLAISVAFALPLLDTALYQVSPDAFFLHVFGMIFGAIVGFITYMRTDV